MLTPPDGLSAASLVSLLAGHWRLAVASIAYKAVGFGSHHWEVTDTAGARWFVTADDLPSKRVSLRESLDDAFDRLRRALAAAADLRAQGYAFVIAPAPASGGAPLVRAGEEFAVALYPFVDGQSFGWGEFPTPAHRQAVLDMVVAVHTAPAAARAQAMTDDYAIPHRDELEALVDPGGGADLPEHGPFSRPMAGLLAGSAVPIRRRLAHYDELAGHARALPARAVLTHGEPHPGNTMLTPAGWCLVDWDTVVVAPPERDLWSLDPSDGSVLRAYAAATGVRPRPPLLELYRVRWDLADLADGVSRFRRRHRGTAEDEKSWRLLRSLVEQISA